MKLWPFGNSEEDLCCLIAARFFEAAKSECQSPRLPFSLDCELQNRSASTQVEKLSDANSKRLVFLVI